MPHAASQPGMLEGQAGPCLCRLRERERGGVRSKPGLALQVCDSQPGRCSVVVGCAWCVRRPTQQADVKHATRHRHADPHPVAWTCRCQSACIWRSQTKIVGPPRPRQVCLCVLVLSSCPFLPKMSSVRFLQRWLVLVACLRLLSGAYALQLHVHAAGALSMVSLQAAATCHCSYMGACCLVCSWHWHLQTRQLQDHRLQSTP